MSETNKKKRKQWNVANMNLAVEAVKNKSMGYLKASKTFGVPKGTLEKYVKKNCICPRSGRKPTLPDTLETTLVEYLLEMDRR